MPARPEPRPSPRRLLSLALLAALGLSACDGGAPAEPLLPPAVPSGLLATAETHGDVRLTWDFPVDAAAGEPTEFRIERAREDGAFAQIAVVAGSARTHLDTGLEPGTRYRYQVRACGEAGCSTAVETSAITLERLEITTTVLRPAILGEPYNGGLNATGGAGGYVWTVESGSLPAGLHLSEKGIISGVPETEQVQVFVARVRSDDGQTTSREFTFQVSPPQGATEVFIDTPRLPPALVGGPYEPTLEASGGSGTFAWALVAGTLPPGTSLLQNGTVSGTPTVAGTFTFRVRATSAARSAEREYTVDVVQNVGGRFDITPFEVVVVPPAILPHVQAAIDRWERIVVGDLPPVGIPQEFFSSTFCGGFGNLLNGTAVDDLIVVLDISPIDGPGRILGQAGPCGLRSGSRLPFVGVLTLDSEDLEPMIGTRTLTDVIFHEIGHVLGFGGMWGAFELVTGGGTPDPRFRGAAARQAWQALGGAGDVPVENTGGTGTRDSHWREATFGNEILTGFAEQVGVAMPLSRVTIASLADLGYLVDYREAESFSPATILRSGPMVQGPSLGYDVVLKGPVRFLPEAPPR